jgi:hypothetical protein
MNITKSKQKCPYRSSMKEVIGVEFGCGILRLWHRTRLELVQLCDRNSTFQIAFFDADNKLVNASNPTLKPMRNESRAVK